VLKNCSVERLARLAIQQLEISGQERHIDSYVELLKQNRLDENTSLDNFERVVNFFQVLPLTFQLIHVMKAIGFRRPTPPISRMRATTAGRPW